MPGRPANRTRQLPSARGRIVQHDMDVPVRVARAKKNLNLVAFEQGQHLPGLRVPATHFR